MATTIEASLCFFEEEPHAALHARCDSLIPTLRTDKGSQPIEYLVEPKNLDLQVRLPRYGRWEVVGEDFSKSQITDRLFGSQQAPAYLMELIAPLQTLAHSLGSQLSEEDRFKTSEEYVLARKIAGQDSGWGEQGGLLVAAAQWARHAESQRKLMIELRAIQARQAEYAQQYQVHAEAVALARTAYNPHLPGLAIVPPARPTCDISQLQKLLVEFAEGNQGLARVYLNSEHLLSGPTGNDSVDGLLRQNGLLPKPTSNSNTPLERLVRKFRGT